MTKPRGCIVVTCDAPATETLLAKGEPKRYRTIVVDPPWDYTGTTFRAGAGHGKKYANKPLPYSSMSIEDLKALPVGGLAAEDAALFLWTTSRYLPQSFDVVRAWGFRYVQMLVWVKPGPMPMSMPFAPPATEFLLGCKRGKPPRKGAFPSSAIVAPQGKHSQKPEAFLDHIEAVGEPPYLELFARRQRLGWDTWGNEAFDLAELRALPYGGPLSGEQAAAKIEGRLL